MKKGLKRIWMRGGEEIVRGMNERPDEEGIETAVRAVPNAHNT